LADFQVEVVRIADPVEDHPNADRLSIIKIGGYVAISAKLDATEAAERGVPEGSHRYKQGDLVAYIPEGAVLPEWLLKRMGFWDVGKDRGGLSGGAGNRVKAIRLRGVFSQGILYPVDLLGERKAPCLFTANPDWPAAHEAYIECGSPAIYEDVEEGDDVASILGITKYEPAVPANFRGNMGALYGVTLKYDFDSIQKMTRLFEPGEWVIATEKLHGTNIQIGVVPGLYEEGGDVYVTSKGLGAKGFNLKDCPENDGNLYVQQLRKVRELGVIDRLMPIAKFTGKPIRLYGEVVGAGIQDLSYGHTTPQLYIFDIQIGDEFMQAGSLQSYIRSLGLTPVPVLYDGPFDLDALAKVRDGKDSISGTHVREGVVIQSASPARKIAKFVSPDYLLRKGEVTEFA
jgi:RNA ligase (TIGR02306 family)